MATRKSPADDVLTAVIRDAVTAVLKPIGFKKTANNFHRRKGSCVQVVNIQGSMGSSAMEKIFYINIGLAFDEICRLSKVPILERPKEYECIERGRKARIGQLVASAPDCWTITATSNQIPIVKRLKAIMGKAADELDRIDDVASFRSSRWFKDLESARVREQILSLLGN